MVAVVKDVSSFHQSYRGAPSDLKGYTLNLKEIVRGPNLTTQSLNQKNTTYTGSGSNQQSDP